MKILLLGEWWCGDYRSGNKDPMKFSEYKSHLHTKCAAMEICIGFRH